MPVKHLRKLVDAVPPVTVTPICAGRNANPTDLRDNLWILPITADACIDTSRKASGEVGTFLHAIKTASIVVDVGANVGFFALLAAKHHVPVLAVEPSAANLEVLLRNVQRSRQTLTYR